MYSKGPEAAHQTRPIWKPWFGGKEIAQFYGVCGRMYFKSTNSNTLTLLLKFKYHIIFPGRFQAPIFILLYVSFWN